MIENLAEMLEVCSTKFSWTIFYRFSITFCPSSKLDSLQSVLDKGHNVIENLAQVFEDSSAKFS